MKKASQAPNGTPPAQAAQGAPKKWDYKDQEWYRRTLALKRERRQEHKAAWQRKLDEAVAASEAKVC